MRIKSMTATFGRLEHATLDLEAGLNLIQAPNEGGKSTWCAFWRAMLYGIDTRGRSKKGHLADKTHYQPWSGSPMEGEIDLEWQGRDVTIRRGPSGSTPFGAFSAVYTGTSEPVPGLTAETCGPLLTGVDREVFERSALIGGGDLAVTASPELEKRIAAIVSSGQEDVSFSQTEATLKDWLNKRKVNKAVGQIPRLESELAETAALDDQLAGLTGEIARLEGDCAQLERAKALCESQLQAHRLLDRQELDRRYTDAAQALEEADGRLRKLEQSFGKFGVLPDREKLKRAQGELQYLKVLDEEIANGQTALQEAEDAYAAAQRLVQETRFAGLTPQEAELRVRKDLQDYAAALAAAHSAAGLARLCPVLGLAAGAGLAAVQYFAAPMPGYALYGAAAAAALGLIALGLVFRSRSKKQKKLAEKALTRWSAASSEELETLLKDYRSRCDSAREAAELSKSVRGGLSEKLARRENDTRDLFDFVHSFAPEVNSIFGCSAALSRALNLDHELALAREHREQCELRRRDLAAQGGKPLEAMDSLRRPGRSEAECAAALEQLNLRLEQGRGELDRARGALSSLGDPAALAARREELTGELARRRQEHEALTVALEALREASAVLQTRFSPELNRLAGAYLSRLTGEKYAGLTLDRQLEGETLREGDVLPHSALYLSRGTLDQLYLAVRLAVCRLCLPQLPPVVLDDALTNFDDDRLKPALELISELAGEQQVLLFTCQGRESRALPAGVHRISLG